MEKIKIKIMNPREYLPIFSINLGIRNTTTSINPIMRPIGLFTRDIMEKGSLICKDRRKHESWYTHIEYMIALNYTETIELKREWRINLVILLLSQWL